MYNTHKGGCLAVYDLFWLSFFITHKIHYDTGLNSLTH